MPQIASEPEAVLPDEDHQPPRGADRQEVQQDGLERQDQRAERPRQQQERQHGDQRDDEREVAVDGVEEVGALRGLAAGHDVGRQASVAARTRSSVARPAGELPSCGRDDRDQRRRRRGASRPGRPRSRTPSTPRERHARRPRGSPERTSASNGDSGPVPMPEAVELIEPRARRARPGPASRRAGCRAGSRRRRRRARPGRRSRRSAATQRWRTTKRAQADQPRLAWSVRPRVAPVEPRTDRGQDDRQQRDRRPRR